MSDVKLSSQQLVPELDEVWIDDMSFEPTVRQVRVGTTVTWVNRSNEDHTVTSGRNGEHDGIFDSGIIPPDGDFSYTFDEIGTYEYFCIPHLEKGMTGTISVAQNI